MNESQYYLPQRFRRKDDQSFDDWLLWMLKEAYIKARLNKRKTNDQYQFEVNYLENLKILRDDIMERKYKPSRGIAFIIYDPVIREVFAAPFRDRVVHHLLYNICNEWWDKRLISESYSCREGKGVLYGIEKLRQQENIARKKFREPVYIIKMDIQGYFMSLPREKLFARIKWGLDRQFPAYGDKRPREYYLTKYLWREIIMDNPVVGAKRRGKKAEWKRLPRRKSLFCQPPGVGIVIGNLSSQLLSNIYLDQLDRFIKFTLGYQFYGRYVDDFYILVPKSELQQAMIDIEVIRQFLLGLNLQLHPKKLYVQDINRGVTYLGSRVYPNRILPGPRVINRYRRTTQQVIAGTKDLSSIQSYYGMFSHFKSYKIQQRIFDDAGWDYYST